jgi:hypothetical protein
MLDAGYWMLDTGYWMLDAGYWLLVAGYCEMLKIARPDEPVRRDYWVFVIGYSLDTGYWFWFLKL